MLTIELQINPDSSYFTWSMSPPRVLGCIAHSNRTPKEICAHYYPNQTLTEVLPAPKSLVPGLFYCRVWRTMPSQTHVTTPVPAAELIEVP